MFIRQFLIWLPTVEFFFLFSSNLTSTEVAWSLIYSSLFGDKGFVSFESGLLLSECCSSIAVLSLDCLTTDMSTIFLYSGSVPSTITDLVYLSGVMTDTSGSMIDLEKTASSIADSF